MLAIKEEKINLNQRRKNNYHIKKKLGEYELRVIPVLKNPISLLDTIHKLVNHQGYLKIQSKAGEFKFYWKGIKNDTYSILNLCDTCIQKK